MQVLLNVRRFALAAAGAAALSCTLAPRAGAAGLDEVFPDGETVLFLGDSITQIGRYIAFIEHFVRASRPDAGVEIINLGLSSETASGLSEEDHPLPRPCIHERLKACLDLAEPDVTFICYGMNDGIYHPWDDGRFAAYQDGMTRLIEEVAAAGSSIVLLTPPPFDPVSARNTPQPEGGQDYGYKKPFAGYSEVLRRYGEWVLAQEEREDVAFAVDLFQPLQDYIRKERESDPSYRFGDGVHPPVGGHAVMAKAILNAFGGGGAASAATDAFIAAGEGDAPEKEPYTQWMKRHRERSIAYREFIGFAKQKDRALIGDREALDRRLAEAGP